MKATTNTLWKICMIFIVSLIMIAREGVAQDKPIGLETIYNWPSVKDETLLSEKGTYCLYELSAQSAKKTILKDLKSKTEISFDLPFSSMISFTSDERYLVYRNGADSVFIFDIVKRNTLLRSRIKKLFVLKTTQSKLIFTNYDNEIFLWNLDTKEIDPLGISSNVGLSKDKRSLYLVDIRNPKDASLKSVNLENGKVNILSHGREYSSILYSDSGKKLFYLDKHTDKICLMSYQLGSIDPVELWNDMDFQGGNGFCLVGINRFSDSGNYVNLTFKRPVYEKKRPVIGNVRIWSFSDKILMPDKPQGPEHDSDELKGLFLLNSSKMLVFGSSNEVLYSDDRWICSTLGQNDRIRVISTKFGRELTLNFGKHDAKNIIGSSLDGDYLIFKDITGFKSYCIAKRSFIPLKNSRKAIWYDRNFMKRLDDSKNLKQRISILSDGTFITSDQYDIWKIDFKTGRPPVCLTDGHGRRDGISFTFATNQKKELIRIENRFLIYGFSPKTQRSGYFLLDTAGRGKIEQRVFSSMKYPNVVLSLNGKGYVVYVQSFDNSPNWYLTMSFEKFAPISDCHPEKDTNWFDVELISCSYKHSRNINGIIYKPKKLVDGQKYPVIMNYYEVRSETSGLGNLHEFKKPELISADINIPWFVSRGYIVVLADIVYDEGKPGSSALKCINLIRDKLEKLPYVDKSKIGLNGHSFGGFETLYILAHSNRFAAAYSGAPLSNISSFYNCLYESIIGWGGTQGITENGQLRMGKNMWERKNHYIENSPVFAADLVKTPLLIMHNKKDNNVPFSQGMEFYLSMRRLKKPCWLLEYVDGSHLVEKPNDKLDLTLRMTSFYDHYLKNNPFPEWMRMGMKYQEKEYAPLPN